MGFHRTLVKRKYRRLFTPRHRGSPGPKGPSPELVDAILEMKRRNPRFGYQRIAEQLALAFGIEIDKHTVRRVLAKRYRPDASGPSWLTLLGHSKDSLWSVDFGRCECIPQSLSFDDDPLCAFHRWRANLGILQIREIKTVPDVPLSHPFVERLIGTIRRELLDQAPFWTSTDLERKLSDFMRYYNRERTHRALGGKPPVPSAKAVADIRSVTWQRLCRGLYQLPFAA
jgi:hypothetical protein